MPRIQHEIVLISGLPGQGHSVPGGEYCVLIINFQQVKTKLTNVENCIRERVNDMELD